MGVLKHVELPDDLLNSLQRRAAAQNISVEEQVVRDLAMAKQEQEDEQNLVGEIRREREAMAAKGVFMTQEDLKKAKEWGRA